MLSSEKAIHKKITPNIQEYLETIYKLSYNGERVKTTKISKNLKIAPGSVTQMIKKLEEIGYVDYSQYKGVKLTKTGLKEALNVTRKHRILERFLQDVLNLKDDVIHEQACEMEHSLSDEAERAMCQVLEHPDKCPGESPIPACDFQFKSCEECKTHQTGEVSEVGKRNENLIPLMDLKKNQEGRIAFIRGDYKVIRRLMDMGITIGAMVNMIKDSTLSEPVIIVIKDSKIDIGRDIACNVFVEIEDDSIT
jgi:DtxR family Mn-dependent transcriptional regulator